MMPITKNGVPIPCAELAAEGGAHSISSSSSSARNSTAFKSTTQVVSVYATQDVFIRFGGSSVTATSSDHFFPAGVYYDFSLGNALNSDGTTDPGHTHLAVIRSSVDGTVYISEKE